MLSLRTVSRRPARTITSAIVLLLASTPALLTAATQPAAVAAATNTITFSPATVNFGNVGVGTTSAPVSVVLTNATASTASFSSFINLATFTINGGTCGTATRTITIAAGVSCTFSVSFSPATTGTVVGAFTAKAGGVSTVFQMGGVGAPPVLSFSPASVNFGSVPVGTISAPVTITAHNLSGVTATLLNATPSLVNFNFQGGTCGVTNHSGTIQAGANCTFTVEFTPATTGLVTGSFTMSSGSGPVTFNLQGTGR